MSIYCSIGVASPLRVTAASIPKTVSISRLCLVAGSHYSSFSYPPSTTKPVPGSAVARRTLSTKSPRSAIKEFFPKVETQKIIETESSWPHPVYTPEQMRRIQNEHRDVRNWSDRFALSMVQVLRRAMDFVTGYRHAPPKGSTGQDSSGKKLALTERQWLNRILFLESVAGVPGMVAGMLRHLRSLRTMRRDNGWIETLLEEAYNERMHLLTFMKIAEPGFFMRMMVLGAQGVYFNGLFFAYLVAPRTCHRFVGYLEEEAVLTYTRIIQEIEIGNLPSWEKMEAPEIAVQYWKMPEGNRSMLDLMLYVRADEAKHREVNHTLGNLDPRADPNPYTAIFRDPVKPKPSKGVDLMKPTGWEREEVI